jgi:hypothetical protein
MQREETTSHISTGMIPASMPEKPAWVITKIHEKYCFDSNIIYSISCDCKNNMSRWILFRAMEFDPRNCSIVEMDKRDR